MSPFDCQEKWNVCVFCLKSFEDDDGYETPGGTPGPDDAMTKPTELEIPIIHQKYVCWKKKWHICLLMVLCVCVCLKPNKHKTQNIK